MQKHDQTTSESRLNLTDLLGRCVELRRLSESRDHRGPGHGGCFAAYGQRGCPCCDADAELNGLVFDLIDRLIVLRDAAEPIVRELQIAGDDTRWRDGDETDRVYPWYEIEPLAEALK